MVGVHRAPLLHRTTAVHLRCIDNSNQLSIYWGTPALMITRAYAMTPIQAERKPSQGNMCERQDLSCMRIKPKVDDAHGVSRGTLCVTTSCRQLQAHYSWACGCIPHYFLPVGNFETERYTWKTNTSTHQVRSLG